VICDRCRSRITSSENQDQALCGGCLAHLRAGGDWALGSPTPVHHQPKFDLELLPFRAHVLFGEVPRYPITSDFHTAASDVFHEEAEPAAHWRLEAIRWRLQHQGGLLNDIALAVIAGQTAARLWLRAVERRS